MSVRPGDVLALKINSHRHHWNGEICSSPTHWRCGSKQDFRENTCARGINRCFQSGVFNAENPKFQSSDQSIVQLLRTNPRFFHDQIILFYGPEFNLTTGRPEAGGPTSDVIYGLYRVKSALVVSEFGLDIAVIQPYPDGWAVAPHNLVRRPFFREAIDGVPYLKCFAGHQAQEVIETAQMQITDAGGAAVLPEALIRRLKQFAQNLEKWRHIAGESLPDELPRLNRQTLFGNTSSVIGEKLSEAMKKHPIVPIRFEESVKEPIAPDSEVAVVELAPVEESPAEVITEESASVLPENARPWARAPLPEEPCRQQIADVYGARVVDAIQIATISKSLLLFAGSTGAGKSRLANQLINDPQRERTVIVPVASTWRGKEDLLGYVNPVSGEFEPTLMTRFLRRAEQAWDRGDRQTWQVIFEEFNLSQPEHWLSDLLVLMEYENRSDRTLRLPGTRIAGETDGTLPEIYLPPTLALVATMNSDHTVRPLSPRVLDRAGLVEITATGREALQRAGVDPTPELEEIVEELNDILRGRDVAFSVRAAKSLRSATEQFGQDKAMFVLDNVLVQEVLSKVRLMAGDKRDGKLLESLQEWIARPVCQPLTLSRQKLQSWDEALQSGRDVFQA